MRISDYKNALNKIDDDELDQHILQRSENAIRFERVLAPPGNWDHAQGAVINAPEQAAQGHNGEEMHDIGDQSLSSKHFLPGFLNDLRNKFGIGIASTCLFTHCPDGNKPITARTVKAVIDQAESLHRSKKEMPPENRSQAEASMRSANDQVISSYLDSSIWIGILTPRHRDPNDLRLAHAGKIGLLEKNAAEFVKAMVTAVCKEHPQYSQDFIGLTDFLAIANDVLSLYCDTLQLPTMTPQLLEATLVQVNKDISTLGASQASARLPVHAAAACLASNLDPTDPHSLMAEAVENAQSDSLLPPFSETCLASIQNAFSGRLREIQSRSASTEPQSLIDAFMSTIELGAQILPEMLESHRLLQTLIDTSPTFSPRQKLWLHQALDEGTLDREKIEGYAQAAGWMESQVLDAIFAPQEGQTAETAIAGCLNTAANSFVEMATLAMETLQNQTPPVQIDEAVFNATLQDLHARHIAFAVAGMSQQEARTLLDALTLADSDTLDPLIEKAGPMARDVLKALTQSLDERAREISLELHTGLLRNLNGTIDYLASRNRSGNIDLPGRTAIPRSVWEAIRDSRLSLKRQDGTSFIDMQDWPQLDKTTKKQRLALGYQEIVDALFDGDKNRALVFFGNLTHLIPAILWKINGAPGLATIQLPDGTPVQDLRGDIQDEFVLTHTEDGLPQFMYVRHIIAPRVAIDARKNNHWLDAKNSDCHYECDCVLTPTTHIALRKPMRLAYKIRLSDWPKKAYPEPVPGNFGPEYSFHDDLFAYAKSNGNPDHIQALTALDALYQFQREPSFDSASSIHAQFIASGALACLGDVTTVPLDDLMEMLNSVNVAPLIEAMANISAELDNTPGDPFTADDHDAMIALKESIATLSANPKMEHLLTQGTEWYSRNGRFSRFLNRIPNTMERALSFSLREAQSQAHRQNLADTDPLLFKPLEDELVRYITREILRGFIESVRSESAAKDTANADS